MKNFFTNILNSIHSPAFYSSIPNKSFKQSISYFLLLVLLLTVIKVITLINPLLIVAPSYFNTLFQDLRNCYPQELEIKITNGQVSTNAKEPYFISCEAITKDPNFNFVVIDTQNSFSVAKFEEYKAGVWVTKDSIVLKRNDYETRAESLAKIKDFKLNKEVVNSYYDKFTPYLKFVGPALLLFSFIGIYIAYNLRLVYLIILSAFIFLISKMLKKGLNYGNSYKIGLHAITLGLVLELIVDLTSRWTHFYGFPFMVSILTLAVVVVNLKSKES